MSLANALVAKVVLGVAATAVLGAGTATVVDRQDGQAKGRSDGPAGQHAVLPSGTTGTAGGEFVIDPGTGALRLLAGPEEARAGVGAGTRTRGGSAPGSRGTVGAPAPQVTTGGTVTGGAGSPGSATGNVTVPGIGASGTAGTTPGGSGGTGGGNTGGSTAPGGSGGGTPPSQGGGWSVTPPAAPDVPSVTAPGTPSSASAYSQGSLTLTVPGTAKVSKKLCLTGSALNKCQTITVPAVRPVELTVSYSGNAGVEAPKFSSAPCEGGMSVGVSGLTPGATLTVVVEGKRVSATVPERSAHQTASLCDA